MKKILKTRLPLPSIWLRILIISLLILGIFFRFANLEKRAYWHDETHTLLRTSGYRVPEVTQKIFNGDVIRAKDLKQFQSINSEKTLVGTMNGLVKEDQHHPIIPCGQVSADCARRPNPECQEQNYHEAGDDAALCCGHKLFCATSWRVEFVQFDFN